MAAEENGIEGRTVYNRVGNGGSADIDSRECSRVDGHRTRTGHGGTYRRGWKLALILVWPGPVALANPNGLTVAIASSDEPQVARRLRSTCVPSV